MGNAKPLTCFVSYAHADQNLATKIAAALRAKTKCQVWTDQDTAPGKNWRRTLDDKVKNSDLFVVVVSPAALSSNTVRDEWATIQARAWEHPVGILPVLVDTPTAPAFLKQWKHIDASDRTIADVTSAVTDHIQSLDTRNVASSLRHGDSTKLSAERTDHFRGLIGSVLKDDWTT